MNSDERARRKKARRIARKAKAEQRSTRQEIWRRDRTVAKKLAADQATA